MAHTVDTYVGRRIRQRRWMLGVTQQQLGAALGISLQQVQKYETGVNRVSASRMWHIGSVLKVPVSYFFEGAEVGANEAEDVVEAPINADKETLDLIRSYYAIPEAYRSRILDLARILSKAA